MEIRRFEKNPILRAEDYGREVGAIFNPAAVEFKGKILLFPRIVPEKPPYKAYSSVIGLMTSKDGFSFKKVIDRVVEPSKSYDRGGCEDPRAVIFENKKFYLTYVGLEKPPKKEPKPPKTILVEVKNPFSKSAYKKIGVITPPFSDNRNVVIFPEKIGGEIVMLHRPWNWVSSRIHKKRGKVYVEYGKAKVPWPEELELPEYFPPKPSIWIARSKDMKNWYGFKVVLEGKYEWESVKVGAGAPPIQTEEGWLCIHHGVGLAGGKRVYSAGAFLLDLDDPAKVVGRTKKPIWFPEEEYEKIGDTANVIFPTGVVKKEDSILVYAGLADKCVGVGIVSLKALLQSLS